MLLRQHDAVRRGFETQHTDLGVQQVHLGLSLFDAALGLFQRILRLLDDLLCRHDRGRQLSGLQSA
jgi:hypothetical protein